MFSFRSVAAATARVACGMFVCTPPGNKEEFFVPSMVHIVRHTAPGVTNFNTGYVAVAAVAATGPEIEYLILAFVAL